jgi:hypothetical protein
MAHVAPIHLPTPFPHGVGDPVYTFRLDQYRIVETRSPHNDTNVVAYTLTVGDQTYTQTLPPSDVNNGNHDICLEFPGIKIPTPSTPVTIAFAIVNAGHNSAAVEAALKAGVDKVIAGEIGNSNPLSSVAMTAVDAALAVIFANCDGTVAADSLKVERSALDATIPAAGRVQTHTKHYPGTDSSTGCGGNSDYYVTQTVIRTHEGDPNGPQPGRPWIITGRSSGLVLDVPGGSHSAGLQIQQYPDNGTAAQHWQLMPTDSGYYMIQSALNGLVLEVAGNSLADHAHIQQAAKTGEKNQQWKFELVPVGTADLPFPVLANSNTYYRIRSRSSIKVFDVPGRSADRVGIQQFAAKTAGYDNQLWELLPLAPPPPSFNGGDNPPPIIP